MFKNSHTEYYQLIMFNAMRVFVFVSLNFTVNRAKLQYNSYILYILDKLC